MTILMMKAKNVMSGIKNGMTLEDFCEKYQCSADEFGERLKQIYGHNKKQLKNCIDQIAANQKKARKETEPDKAEETRDVDDDVDGAAGKEMPSAASKEVELLSLTELEKRQSQHVMALESEHKTLATEHRALKNSLRGISDSIDRLMGEFRRYHNEFEEILSRNAIVEARMNEVSAEWNEEIAALTDTRNMIEELSTVTLCVYASGEITPMDGCEVTLSDAGWETTREVLLLDDACQELRLKDISVLARLLVIAEHADCKLEVVCDNDELEAAFWKLRAK